MALVSSGVADSASQLEALPSEILRLVFPHLDGATFIRSQRVCRRWKMIIEDMHAQLFETIWRHFTLRQFRDRCNDTLRCCKHFMNWYQIYKSVYLWPRVATSEYTVHTIIKGSEYIHGIKVVENHLISLVRGLMIDSDLDHLEVSPSIKIAGSFLDFKLNECCQVILSSDRTAYMSYVNKELDVVHMFPDVLVCALLNESLFYRVNDGLCIFDNTGTVKKLLIKEDIVGALAVRADRVYCRTEEKHFSFNEQGLPVEIGSYYTLDEFSGLLATFSHYHSELNDLNNVARMMFLGDALRAACNFMFVKNADETQRNWEKYLCTHKPLITAALIYNDLIILGTSKCLIHIVELEDFKLLREIEMPQVSNGILDVKVRESTTACDLIVATTDYVTILRFRRQDLAKAALC